MKAGIGAGPGGTPSTPARFRQGRSALSLSSVPGEAARARPAAVRGTRRRGSARALPGAEARDSRAPGPRTGRAAIRSHRGTPSTLHDRGARRVVPRARPRGNRGSARDGGAYRRTPAHRAGGTRRRPRRRAFLRGGTGRSRASHDRGSPAGTRPRRDTRRSRPSSPRASPDPRADRGDSHHRSRRPASAPSRFAGRDSGRMGRLDARPAAGNASCRVRTRSSERRGSSTDCGRRRRRVRAGRRADRRGRRSTPRGEAACRPAQPVPRAGDTSRTASRRVCRGGGMPWPHGRKRECSSTRTGRGTGRSRRREPRGADPRGTSRTPGRGRAIPSRRPFGTSAGDSRHTASARASRRESNRRGGDRTVRAIPPPTPRGRSRRRRGRGGSGRTARPPSGRGGLVPRSGAGRSACGNRGIGSPSPRRAGHGTSCSGHSPRGGRAASRADRGKPAHARSRGRTRAGSRRPRPVRVSRGRLAGGPSD